MSSKRQSNFDFPRSVFNSGATSRSGINGQEYVGFSLMYIIALPNMLKYYVIENKFAKI